MLAERISQSRELQFWLLQLIGWFGWVSLFSLRDAYWGHPLDNLVPLLIDAVAGMILTTCLRYVYRSVWDKSTMVRIVTVLSASYVAAAIWQPVQNYSQVVYYQEYELLHEFSEVEIFQGMIGYSYFLLLCWSVLYFGLKFHQSLQEEKQRSIRAESLAHESQLRMLRYQLNPHFLFNTLNAISTLILDKQPESANNMLARLSSFLRYSLDKDPMVKVDLTTEIGSMELYLDIEKARFEDRLHVDIRIADDVGDALVPSMVLQPLIENAIKYAVSVREDGGQITILGERENNHLLLTVRDNGPGMTLSPSGEPAGTGVGLGNTINRLQVLYGDEQSCSFSSAEGEGLTVSIRIPYEST